MPRLCLARTCYVLHEWKKLYPCTLLAAHNQHHSRNKCWHLSFRAPAYFQHRLPAVPAYLRLVRLGGEPKFAEKASAQRVTNMRLLHVLLAWVQYTSSCAWQASNTSHPNANNAGLPNTINALPSPLYIQFKALSNQPTGGQTQGAPKKLKLQILFHFWPTFKCQPCP